MTEAKDMGVTAEQDVALRRIKDAFTAMGPDKRSREPLFSEDELSDRIPATFAPLWLRGAIGVVWLLAVVFVAVRAAQHGGGWIWKGDAGRRVWGSPGLMLIMSLFILVAGPRFAPVSRAAGWMSSARMSAMSSL